MREPSAAKLCNLPMTCLKNLCTLHSGFVATQRALKLALQLRWSELFSAGPLPARKCFFLILSGF
jgi:hypothetical protein